MALSLNHYLSKVRTILLLIIHLLTSHLHCLVGGNILILNVIAYLLVIRSVTAEQVDQAAFTPTVGRSRSTAHGILPHILYNKYLILLIYDFR